jgi:hypothetical protein
MRSLLTIYSESRWEAVRRRRIARTRGGTAMPALYSPFICDITGINQHQLSSPLRTRANLISHRN